MADREPTIINTGSSGNGGWAVAVILLIALFAVGFYLFGGALVGDRDIDVDVSLPKVEAPAAAEN